MGSAAVPRQLWGTDSHDGAEVAATLVRLSLYPVPAILGGLRNQHVRPAQ